MTIVHSVNKTDFSLIRERLLQNGFKLYDIDCTEVHDKSSFFQSILQQGLPMGQAEISPEPQEAWRFPSGWDAFNDFFWQGIMESGERDVAIVVSNTQHLQVSNPLLLHEILRGFSDVANLINYTERGKEDGVCLCVYFLS